MGADLRVTLNVLRVLGVLYARMDAEHYGLELSKAAGLSNGALYPILDKLEDHGLVVARWEELDERAAGRRRRCYYRLTAQGFALAEQELRQVRTLGQAPVGVRHA